MILLPAGTLEAVGLIHVVCAGRRVDVRGSARRGGQLGRAQACRKEVNGVANPHCEVRLLGRMALDDIQIEVAREHVVDAAQTEAKALGDRILAKIGERFLKFLEKHPVDRAEILAEEGLDDFRISAGWASMRTRSRLTIRSRSVAFSKPWSPG